MENAIDALYIAGAILLMLVALTISISSFSTQIAQVDAIVQADERIDVVTTADGSGFLNYITYSEKERKVGVETVVNSLYRGYKENYTVYMKLNSSYSPSGIEKKGDYLVFRITTEYNLQNAKEKLNGILNSGLYNRIKNSTFKEYMGTLYQDDITTNPDAPHEKISDANKTKIRIITYVEQ